MALITYTSLAGEFNPHVPGVPDPVMEYYIRKVVIDLCERAKIWRVLFASMSVQQGVYQYTVTSPVTQTELSAILDAKVRWSTANKIDDLQVMSNEQVFSHYPTYPELAGFLWRGVWSSLTAYSVGDVVCDSSQVTYRCIQANTNTALSNTAYWTPMPVYMRGPVGLTRFDELTVNVVPIPDAADTYTLYLMGAIRPTMASTTFEGSLYATYKRAIFHGVLYELMNMPARPWSNDKKVEHHGKQWEYFVSQARARANKGFGRADICVRQSPWA